MRLKHALADDMRRLQYFTYDILTDSWSELE